MNGSCLCGDVNWTTKADLRDVYQCHCARCQRVTGNFMAATAAPTERLEITGGALRWYSPDDDPNVGYGFCSLCGSSMFFRSGLADDTNDITSICAGSIHGASGLKTTEVWFANNAADHVRLDPTITSFPTSPER